jgi:hypothetical protein
MSLTSFLSESPEIRSLLKTHFPLEYKSVVFPHMKAPPLTTNYALIGQAFDYLLRFYMQRHNPHAPRRGLWIADFVRDTPATSSKKNVANTALPYVENAHRNHERYLEDGQATDELLASCLDLAAIDGLFRAGELRGSLGVADPRDLRDLRNLLALVPSTPFLDGEKVHLNPAFAFPSGADCDLWIDTALIEIKTTKLSGLKQEQYQQVLGYLLCILHRQYEQGRDLFPCPVQHLGVYFSRHGFLWMVDISTIASEEVFHRFLPLWDEHVKGYHEERIVLRARRESSVQSIEALIVQVDALKSLSSYMHWLSQLSDADFSTWKACPLAPYYAHGAIEAEQERRAR